MTNISFKEWKKKYLSVKKELKKVQDKIEEIDNIGNVFSKNYDLNDMLLKLKDLGLNKEDFRLLFEQIRQQSYVYFEDMGRITIDLNDERIEDMEYVVEDEEVYNELNGIEFQPKNKEKEEDLFNKKQSLEKEKDHYEMYHSQKKAKAEKLEKAKKIKEAKIEALEKVKKEAENAFAKVEKEVKMEDED